jgi:hypothetical protein
VWNSQTFGELTISSKSIHVKIMFLRCFYSSSIAFRRTCLVSGFLAWRALILDINCESFDLSFRENADSNQAKISK